MVNGSQVLNTHAFSQFLNTHARRLDSDKDEFMTSGAMAEEEKFLRGKSAHILCIIRSKRVQNMYATHREHRSTI